MGVLDGINVLDLSRGIAGPITTMLLADHGAKVTRIESPSGDPREGDSGYRVWHRGKRSAVLDLKAPADRARLHALARIADVLVESFAPGTGARLGIDNATLAALNPRLIHCSITGYGPDGPDADRPGLDALVAARTGYQWEVRGVAGGSIGRLSGTEGMLPGLTAPPGCWVGPDRDGPLFNGVPWPSLGAAYIATVAVNAALLARETTGRGQHINTSLLHGVLATTVASWQRAERSDTPSYQSWVIDPRAPKGFFRASDGRWTHHWVPLPEFILTASSNGMRVTPDLASPKNASLRVTPMAEDMVVLHAYQNQLAEAVAKYSSSEWVELAAKVGVPVQTVRSPEEALLDPLLLADGCVVEVSDQEVGPIRQVGRVVELQRHPQPVPAPAPKTGQHTVEVIAEADALLAAPVDPPVPPGRSPAAPLAGVTVLDLGLAVAGPFGTQVLAELGARVIKVNAKHDTFWLGTHLGMCCNRDKESITLDLKQPEAMAVLHRLVRGADVVQHNMRYDAAQRLGVDYESLRRHNPGLVYCHTIGHEQGPREQLPGNDQTAAALAGTSWLDGGLDDDGRPIWSCTSLGDTGNGFLSALGIIQALYDRRRTGEGQFVRTSILYAHLLNASTAWVSPDGEQAGARQRVDAQQYGWHALYSLYQAAEGWLCLAALTEADWAKLGPALGRPDLTDDVRFATAAARAGHDAELVAELSGIFSGRTAREWFTVLDAHGVPCEVSDPDYVLRLFADPDAAQRKVLASFRHRTVGELTMAGRYFDLSDTPGTVQGPPLWPGQNSAAILAGLGYSPEEIAGLIESGVVDDTSEVTADAP
ncbi:MAG TPA: CoA transferase [Pseudonocardiaceae bacterium]|jgi:crotonobetainyl-CoA:carnitine CoA-transferase CaiB-like acyl-CoA transferase|nr:CoA transferase [Pseudonocardiaceae bacterium]